MCRILSIISMLAVLFVAQGSAEYSYEEYTLCSEQLNNMMMMVCSAFNKMIPEKRGMSKFLLTNTYPLQLLPPWIPCQLPAATWTPSIPSSMWRPRSRIRSSEDASMAAKAPLTLCLPFGGGRGRESWTGAARRPATSKSFRSTAPSQTKWL